MAKKQVELSELTLLEKRWRGGLAVSRSEGEGNFALSSKADRGSVESDLTSVFSLSWLYLW